MIPAFVFRGRNKNPIGPGKYGYGKVPYILPLQTDTGQSPHRPRRQRQLAQEVASQPGGGTGSPYGRPTNPSHHQGNLHYEDRRPRPQGASGPLYRQAVPHFQAFPASQSLFHGTALSAHVPVSRQPVRGQPPSPRASAIVCTGAYKQHKLCNTNVSWRLICHCGKKWPRGGGLEDYSFQEFLATLDVWCLLFCSSHQVPLR